MNSVAAPSTVSKSLLGGYASRPGAFDELLDAQGQPREHWRGLIESFDSLGRDDFNARCESARRILRENGVTYNVYGDAQGLSRPWSLDLIPFVVPSKDWQFLEAGLTQRTRLLNAILSDFHGPQRLLKEGWLPPALMHANPGFLRPCHGIRPPRDISLFLHAVDLARSPDGRWWALADRTQAPSGAGYALENRIVSSRVLPNEFRKCHVQRLAEFFQIQRDTLRSLAPKPQGLPNVVLLTPGPYNETYFEHVYFARYLGFPLVEGPDLTVRDRRVFLKTLEGLQQVDVILRRVDDTYCDPLELRQDSFLGVAGLVDAARAENVTIANALGSGAVEMPALLPFLPGLCRHLLGEEVLLPSVATWWCGQEAELSHVIANLARLVIKRAFVRAGGEPLFGARLTKEAKEELIREMRAAPYEFVAQEQLELGTVPVWEHGRLEARPVSLRTYISASEEGHQVMPGGLSRFSSSPDRLVVSMQSGGGSKDTWVLSDGPVTQTSLLKAGPAIVRLERAAAEVPSRLADNFYWLGRYAERIEDAARILRCILGRLAGETGGEETLEMSALVRLLINLDLLPKEFRDGYTMRSVEREVFQLIYQANRLGSIREVLGRLREISFELRDRFSADTWRVLNQLQTDARPVRGRLPAAEAHALLNTLIVDLAAFSGMETENMTRGHGWGFLEIGRRLERAANMISLAQGGLAVQTDGFNPLELMIEIADSSMTYRRRYFAQPQWPATLDLLLTDETNPRSLMFQVQTLVNRAADLPTDPHLGGIGREWRLIKELRARLAGADLQTLAASELAGEGPALSQILEAMAASTRSISDSINHHYFSHADARVS